MDRIDELIQEYRQAQEEIIAEAERNPKGTEREYRKHLLAKITAILGALYVYTEQWSGKNIPELYENGMRDSYAAVNAQYKAAGKAPPDMADATAVDDAAIRTARTNINSYLTDAIEQTREHMQTEIRQAAMKATEEAITKGQATKAMQENLIAMLEGKGVQSVPYIRNGETCYMQLDAYAELVARTTEHEIRNTANINLGTRIGNDLVQMSEHWGACPVCTPYQGRVFSVSGTNPYYPYLYDTPWSSMYQNFHPRCRHVLTQYIEGLHTPEENTRMREFSNRSFEVGGSGWTKKQTEAANRSLANYRKGQARKRKLYTDRKQYERYRLVLGDDAPKTFSGFRRMKAADSERWRLTELDYRRRNRLVDNPELALPNAEKATAADAKFTKYLFGGNNANGLAKGRAFESRLGYNISNWEEFRNEIFKQSRMNAVTITRTDEYGTHYDQNMVVYGLKSRPMSIRVAWEIREQGGAPRFVTTYPD